MRLVQLKVDTLIEDMENTCLLETVELKPINRTASKVQIKSTS